MIVLTALPMAGCEMYVNPQTFNAWLVVRVGDLCLMPSQSIMAVVRNQQAVRKCNLIPPELFPTSSVNQLLMAVLFSRFSLPKISDPGLSFRLCSHPTGCRHRC